MCLSKDGIVIKTVAQRKGRSVDENTLIAKTRPCLVNRISGNSCRMTLVEGRNRQIRKMMEALGHMVVRLHRVEFMGIRLSYDGGDGRGPSSLSRPGDWSYLNEDEMSLIEDALWSSSEKM
jgi:23S rRNA pseudouridine2604 synthase